MNIADKYFIETLKELKNTSNVDVNPRAKYKDGTPANTKFITQKTFTYDISKGEFPINTLRNTAIKEGFKEIQWIYQEQSNSKNSKYFPKWWQEWLNKEGNLGTAYAHNINDIDIYDTNSREVVNIEKRLLPLECSAIIPIPIVNNILTSVDGKVYQSEIGKGFIIVDKRYEITPNGIYKYKIQFLETGSFKNIRGNDLIKQIKKNQVVKDNYFRFTQDVGYLGDYETSEENTILQIRWNSMFKRCYSKAKNSCYYNIKVNNEWHCFANFLKDVKKLPNYKIAKKEGFKNWDLDKDYYSSNMYSKYSCIWLPKKENILYASNKPLIITDKYSGVSRIFLSKELAAIYIGKSASALRTALHKKERLLGAGYCNFNFDVLEKGTYRYKLPRNQVDELLNNLKEDKFSRRHMLSMFNWKNQPLKQLVECAYMLNISVRVINNTNYIDSTLTIRSSDFITAGFINKTQYLMLCMMIAGHLSLETSEQWVIGNFMCVIQNLHVYDRHLWAIDELLSRKTKEQPKIELLSNKNFYDYTIEDFKITLPKGIEKLNKVLELAI